MPIDLTLSSGETVKVYPVSPFTLAMAGATVKMPEAPMLTIHVGPAEGGHDEQHPDTDPKSAAYQTYLKAREEAEEKRNRATNDASLLFGLRDVPLPADDNWLAPLKFVGLSFGDDPNEKRLAYLKHCVLTTEVDITDAYEAVALLSYGGAKKADQLEAFFRNKRHGQGDAATTDRSGDETGPAGSADADTASSGETSHGEGVA